MAIANGNNNSSTNNNASSAIQPLAPSGGAVPADNALNNNGPPENSQGQSMGLGV